MQVRAHARPEKKVHGANLQMNRYVPRLKARLVGDLVTLSRSVCLPMCLSITRAFLRDAYLLTRNWVKTLKFFERTSFGSGNSFC